MLRIERLHAGSEPRGGTLGVERLRSRSGLACLAVLLVAQVAVDELGFFSALVRLRSKVR